MSIVCVSTPIPNLISGHLLRCWAPTTGKPAVAVRYYGPHLPSHNRGVEGENPRMRMTITYTVEVRFATVNPERHSSSTSSFPIFPFPTCIDNDQNGIEWAVIG